MKYPVLLMFAQFLMSGFWSMPLANAISLSDLHAVGNIQKKIKTKLRPGGLIDINTRE